MKQTAALGKRLTKENMNKIKGGYTPALGSCTYSFNCGGLVGGGTSAVNCTSATGDCDWVKQPSPNGGPAYKIGVKCDGKEYKC